MVKHTVRVWIRGGGAVATAFVAAAASWFSLGGAMRAAPVPDDPMTCLPTCAIDGRMLVVAGNDPTTLGNVQIEVGLSFTSGSSGFNFELFDGDRDPANWDVPFNDGTVPKPDAPELLMELYPIGDGGKQPTPLIRFGPGYFPLPAANGSWGGLAVPFHVPQALVSATGGYTYSLVITPVNPAVDLGWNAFKVRANGTVSLNDNQVVAFLGAMNVGDGTGANGDIATIYPNWPSLADSVYDGTWSFRTRLDPFLQEFVVWDGDMDYGNAACDYTDTDDPDTPAVNSNVFANGSAPEGVADVNGGCRTGLPSDDQGNAIFERKPSILPNGIVYRVKAPGSPANPSGQVFVNPNPSGNREWEQFRIQKVASAADVPNGACPAGGYPADGAYEAADCRTTDLPGGVWEIQLDGMDLSNLNFWYFTFKSEPISEEYSIGRLVWYDEDEDGVQDMCSGVPCANEPGIPNVLVSVSLNGVPVTGGLTDANGEFLFTPLGAGDYVVTVEASNFDPGGPLEGLTSTTGGEVQSGIEVGLPVCIDTNNPADCGDPLYAEALFGYVEHSEECVVYPINGGAPFLGATHAILPNPAGAPAGAVTIRTTLSRDFVDNSYGVNKVGWPKGHNFSDLVESDKMQLALYDSAGVKQLEFIMDYISASGGAPGGYTTLGVTGGEGIMILGNASDIFAVDTSLALNFANGMWLTSDSPATDASYTPNPTYPDWIFDVYYDVTILPGAFGAAGFGYPRLAGLHASPSKTGSNSEACLYFGDPAVAGDDAFETVKNNNLVVGGPGVLDNDAVADGGPLTAVLVAGPSNGALVGGLNADGSFTYAPNTDFTGDETFTYQATNANGPSNVATVSIKVKKK